VELMVALLENCPDLGLYRGQVGTIVEVYESGVFELEQLGLVKKQLYSNHSRRMNYQLTEQGQSLLPVLKAIIDWGLDNIPETRIPQTHRESQT
jgi:hypothetical protein